MTVVLAGAGTGVVRSQAPVGIDCGAVCSAATDPEETVILNASPATDSVFTSWTGPCSGGGSTCVVSMSASTSVTANFSLKPLLTLTLSGNGRGTVTSTPGGISCDRNCAAPFEPNRPVTLTAVAESGSTFAGWSGACANQTNTCSVNMDTSKSVNAAFNAAPPPPPAGGGNSGGGGGSLSLLDFLVLLALLQVAIRRLHLLQETRGRRSSPVRSEANRHY